MEAIAPFEAGVVGLSEVSEVRGGDGVHDAAAGPLIAHAQRGLLPAQEGPEHVHAQHLAEILVGHLEEGLVADVARVVHEDVDRAECVDALRDQGPGAGARADVVAARDRLAALGGDLLDHLAGLGEVDVADHHARRPARPGGGSAPDRCRDRRP